MLGHKSICQLIHNNLISLKRVHSQQSFMALKENPTLISITPVVAHYAVYILSNKACKIVCKKIDAMMVYFETFEDIFLVSPS